MTTARAPVCARKGGAGQAGRLGQRRPGRHNDIGPERRDYRLGDGADTDVALPPVDILYRRQEARGGRTGGPVRGAPRTEAGDRAYAGALIRVWVPPPCLGLSPGIEVERREARGARIPRHSFDCHIREAGWPSEWQADPGLFLPGSARGLSRVTASRSSRRDDQQLRGDAGPVCAGAQGAAPGRPIKADRTGLEPHRAAPDAPVM